MGLTVPATRQGGDRPIFRPLLASCDPPSTTSVQVHNDSDWLTPLISTTQFRRQFCGNNGTLDVRPDDAQRRNADHAGLCSAFDPRIGHVYHKSKKDIHNSILLVTFNRRFISLSCHSKGGTTPKGCTCTALVFWKLSMGNGWFGAKDGSASPVTVLPFSKPVRGRWSESR